MLLSTKIIAALGVALLLSMAGNYWQHRIAITATLRDQNAGLKDAQEKTAGLLADVQDSTQRLTTAANAASAQLDGAKRDYRDARNERPLTDTYCAPGQDRMDAVNRALGAPQSE